MKEEERHPLGSFTLAILQQLFLGFLQQSFRNLMLILPNAFEEIFVSIVLVSWIKRYQSWLWPKLPLILCLKLPQKLTMKIGFKDPNIIYPTWKYKCFLMLVLKFNIDSLCLNIYNKLIISLNIFSEFYNILKSCKFYDWQHCFYLSFIFAVEGPALLL